jgi:predicted Zn-dependent peptidase
MPIDMNLHRNIQPQTGLVSEINFPFPEKVVLDSGIPVYLINSGSQDILKIEFIFGAGIWQQEKPLVSRITSKMLKEGTTRYNSHEIAEKIDYYGAHLETSSDKDTASVSLYTLNKHLEHTLEILVEVIREPVFPHNELSRLLQNRKQKFVVNNEKVRFIAKREFDQLIFGKEIPYGKLYHIEDFDKVETQDLIDFYRKFYIASNCKIVVAGKIPDNLVDLLNRQMNGFITGYTVDTNDLERIQLPENNRLNHIMKQDALQSAIRIGRVMFNKTHPDYPRFKVLNTVLGGYFGSRLMTNIREEKGYTYGIGSALVSLHRSGYFFIASEVGADVTQEAINEIYMEIDRLQQEKIPENELNLVRNYMLGAFLRSLDGPFAQADSLKEIVEYGLDYSYYENFIRIIKSITPEELRDLAQKYLDKNEIYELRVGR